MAKNLINKKYYIKGNIELVSPLIIASGDDEFADLQCVRNWDNELFIPATSIAGAIRNHILDHIPSKEEDSKHEKYADLKTYWELGTNSNQSCFQFFDVMLEDKSKNEIIDTEIRDGIKLDNFTRTTIDKAKYDFEIIPAQSFDNSLFRMVITVWQDDDEESLLDITEYILKQLEDANIRLGAKTSRGFGKIKLTNVKKQIFDFNKFKDNDNERQKFIHFGWESEFEDYESNNNNKYMDILNDKVFSMNIDFKIEQTIMIKSQIDKFEKDDGLDYKFLESNANNVIPGTSWAGVFQHALENIGDELNISEKMNELINKLFGFVDDKTKEAQKSKIIFNESIINESKKITYTRNKIDRFTGGTVNGALFKEEFLVGGNIKLDIDGYDLDDYEIGMLVLVLHEIDNGIQTLGGESNIGRGRLKIKGININSGTLLQTVTLRDEGIKSYMLSLKEKLMEIQ